MKGYIIDNNIWNIINNYLMDDTEKICRISGEEMIIEGGKRNAS